MRTPPSTRRAASRGNRFILGIGEGAVRRGDGVLITHGLGSCIAVTASHPASKTGGLYHAMLPDSKSSPPNTRSPFVFVDSGLRLMLQRFVRAGIDPKTLTIGVFGGARMGDPNSPLDVGKRNALACKRALWAYGIRPARVEVGGRNARSVSLHTATGRVDVQVHGLSLPTAAPAAPEISAPHQVARPPRQSRLRRTKHFPDGVGK